MAAIELEVAGHPVRVTNPDKIYFPEPGFTKLDVVRYYLAVGDGILRALRERPTTLERFPGGVTEEAFYQKRLPTKGVPEWIESAPVTFPSGRGAQELCPVDLAHVAWAANLGTIVFHPWPVRRADPDAPDELRIDLDPQPGTTFADAAVAAVELRAVLAELGIVAFPKTSGGRGIHVYVRIEPRWSFVQVRRAVIALARELARRRPDLVTVNWWKEERGERIFVDYNQMARDRTIACAYSLRATPRATVSTPLTWDELAAGAAPEDFTLATVPARLAAVGDPHAAIDEVAHDITPLLEWSAGEADLPYPPDHPKMPGEPPRVQPSRQAGQRRPASGGA